MIPIDDYSSEMRQAAKPPAKVELTHNQSRSRRRYPVRARTESMKRLPKYRLQLLSEAFPEKGYWRPTTRADCAEVERPCPYVGCRFHLYLDVVPKTGAIKFNRPDIPVDELERMPATCALDVAEAGGHKLEDVGALLNVTRERIRQVQDRILAKLERHPVLRRLLEAMEAAE